MEKKKGLTIIELLLTITILIATVTTVLALGNRAVSNGGLFTAYTQATFLAKEALEILEDETTRGVILSVDDGVSYWRLDYANGPTEDMNIEDCSEKLRIDPIHGFYKIGSHPEKETIFSRCIIVDKNGSEIKVEVDVSFEYRNKEHNINLFRVFYE
jgi:hypothetical protein